MSENASSKEQEKNLEKEIPISDESISNSENEEFENSINKEAERSVEEQPIVNENGRVSCDRGEGQPSSTPTR